MTHAKTQRRKGAPWGFAQRNILRTASKQNDAKLLSGVDGVVVKTTEQISADTQRMQQGWLRQHQYARSAAAMRSLVAHSMTCRPR
jgi:hypothetical protein